MVLTAVVTVAVACVAESASAAKHGAWLHFDGNGCDYALASEPVAWDQAAYTCSELSGAKLASVWSVAEAAFIAGVRGDAPAWVFGYAKGGEWNLDLAENQLWSPTEPKDASTFAFCAQQAADKGSHIRFRASVCASQAAAICKRCPTVEHHFEVALSGEHHLPRAVGSRKAEALAAMNPEAFRARRAATSTTTTTTTAEPEEINSEFVVGDADEEATSRSGAAASSAAAVSAIAGIVCAIVGVLLVAVMVTMQRQRTASATEAEAEGCEHNYDAMAKVLDENEQNFAMEWDNDNGGYTFDAEPKFTVV